MRSLGWVLVMALALLGCRVGYRTTAGGTHTPPGFAGGNTRSLYMQDEGGLLSRAALGALGVVAAVGTVDNVQTTTDVDTKTEDDGTRTETTTQTTTGTINPERGAQVQGYFDKVGDSKTSFITRGGGPTVGLEIASEHLGGDTSGGGIELGWTFHYVKRFSRAGVGVRFFLGYGYTKYTFHQRRLTSMDRGPPQYADAGFKFSGLPLRLGVFGLRVPDGITSLVGTETYVEASLNLIDQHTFAIGQRLQLSLGFIEVEVSRGTTDGHGDHTSVGLELGAGF